MAILRYIDADGRENDVDDVNHLYELIQERRVSFESLVWDGEQQRWVRARDHEFFRRIREIAAAAPTPLTGLQPWSVSPSREPVQPTAPTPQVYKSPLMQHKNADAIMAASDKPKSKWFKPIHTREEALKTIKESSSGFFVVAALQGIIGLWLTTQPNSGFDIGETMIDVAIYAVFAAWLRWGRSRTAAIILLLTATIAVGTTIGAQLKIIQGGKNIWLALIVFWAAVKAVEATFKLRGRFKHGETAAEPQFG